MRTLNLFIIVNFKNNNIYYFFKKKLSNIYYSLRVVLVKVTIPLVLTTQDKSEKLIRGVSANIHALKIKGTVPRHLFLPFSASAWMDKFNFRWETRETSLGVTCCHLNLEPDLAPCFQFIQTRKE